MKMITSSNIVPREPINHGRLVRKYSLSVEWQRICIGKISKFLMEDRPSVTYACAIGQISQERKDEKQKRQSYMIVNITANIHRNFSTYLHRTSRCSSYRSEAISLCEMVNNQLFNLSMARLTPDNIMH